MQSETLVEEFSRLVREYKQDDGPGGIEAWNLIADFAVDNAETIEAALSAAEPVSSIVPKHCSGTSLVFQGGCLHVRTDGSGHIVVDEDDFKLEDDRQEGEQGPEGSVHWIARFPAGEMTALRDFLNGQDFPTLSVQVQDESEIVDCLLAGKPFVFDPATNFCHADDGGAPEHGIKYVPAAQVQDVSGWQLVPKDDESRCVADSALPHEMIEAGIRVQEQVNDDHCNYVAGETTDWDCGMVAVAIYRAMLAAAPAKQEGGE